jgi:hypothetical protein
MRLGTAQTEKEGISHAAKTVFRRVRRADTGSRFGLTGQITS